MIFKVKFIYMARRSQFITIEQGFFLLISAIVVYLFWIIIKPFALVLITALIAAIVLVPLDKKLNKFLKHPKTSSAIISLGVVMLVFVPMMLLLFVMATQASDLLKTSFADQNWITGIRGLFAPLVSLLPKGVQAYILTYDLNALGSSIAKLAFENIGDIFASTTKLILNTFLFFIALYYFMVDRNKLFLEALNLSPLRDTIDTKILKKIIKTVRSVVFGVLLLAIIQGIFAAIGMSIFGVPAALLWGAATILAALVPLVGSALILGPAILYLLFTGSATSALGLLIWSVIVVGLADNFLGPYLIKGTAHMHAFLVLLAILGGIYTFGYVGIIIGPTILAAGLALLELYKSGAMDTKK